MRRLVRCNRRSSEVIMTINREAWDVMRTGARTLLMVAAVGGCGDDGNITPDAQETPADAPEVTGCAAGSFTWSFTFHEGSNTGPAVVGVHACVLTHPSIPCGDSGLDGSWTFCAPENSEMAVAYEKAGYMSAIRTYVTGTTQPTKLRATTLVMRLPDCALWSSAGAACPPSATDPGGMLWIGAREYDVNAELLLVPIGDVSISLSPASLIAPFYGVGTADPNLTGTHPGNGNATAADVLEGDQQLVTITHPTRTCRGYDYHAWAGPTADTIRAPIRRGFRTFVPVTCE
jgi:hypothetical protein